MLIEMGLDFLIFSIPTPHFIVSMSERLTPIVFLTEQNYMLFCDLL